uniref:TIR domain-containing protein n=1 Tax=Branchiostoma floridae TaxID=7739 RepID=C3ZIX9_BRAFL|eukprot:XP_002591484.1 hypothetical protein BRAFLDRAFT_105256 [Branchiostoma floridae]
MLLRTVQVSQQTQARLTWQSAACWVVVILLMTEGLSGCVVYHLSADCRYSRLQDVPAHLPSDITHLDLSFNHLSSLPNLTFSHLTHLVWLDLSSNLIDYLEPDTFANLTLLQKLSLHDNQLRSLPPTVFRPLPALRSLRLSGNSLSSILDPWNQDVWKDLHLELLDLSGNFLESAAFPETFSAMKSLQKLYLSGNQIWSFSKDDFAPFKGQAFQILDLSLNPAYSFEPGFFQQFTTVEYLDLSQLDLSLPDLQGIFADLAGLNLTRLRMNDYDLSIDPIFATLRPDTFDNLIDTPLQHLELSSSAVQNISDHAFRGLPELMTLDLSQNSLSWLPQQAFSGLGKLRVLILSFNLFSQVPGEALTAVSPTLETLELNNVPVDEIRTRDFGTLPALTHLAMSVKLNGLRQLQRLNLTSNRLGLLPNFDPVSTLELLDLSHNQVFNERVTDISERPFCNLSNLVYLSLSHNRLDVIQKTDTTRFFEGLVSLEVLKMSQTGDPWKAFGNAAIFDAMPALKVLDLSSSGIAALPGKVFRIHHDLEGLDLSDNQILSLPGQLFPSSLESLRVVSLRGNRISVLPESRYGYFVRGLETLDMQDNFFQCDCDIQWFVSWANASGVVRGWEGGGYTCSSPSSLNNKALHSYDPDCMTYTSLYTCIVTTTLISLYILTCFVVHQYGWWFGYVFYIAGRAFRHREAARNPALRFRYDAFVAYSSYDERWITDQLVRNLENGDPSYRLCIGARDFVGGLAITENIARSVEASRKTICVITRHFMSSSWCNYELQASEGRYHVFDPRCANVVLVFLEKIPEHVVERHKTLKTMVARDTYLVWPRDERRQTLFWARLRDALGQPLDQDDQIDLGVIEEDCV